MVPIISYGNSYTYILKKEFISLVNYFLLPKKKSRILNDTKIEIKQFGICSSTTNKLEEIPYFHY